MSKLVGGALVALFVTAWPYVAVMAADAGASVTDTVVAGVTR